MTVSTPLRDLPTSGRPLAAEPEPGSVAHTVRTILDSSGDLSSWSDELTARGNTWPASYFVAPARANVLRGLPLPASATVLEIGARAGALTRHLGEESMLVDALEPDPQLAELAALRCADLPAVVIHPVWLDEVPAEPVYDVVVAVDVTGELARRDMSVADLLAACRDRLKPSGVIVFCVDNADGVRLAAGAGLPEPGVASADRPVRMSSADLAAAIETTGMSSWTGSAFPDHRQTQILFDHDALAAVDARLLTGLPHLPSPSYGTPAPAPDREVSAWAAAVDAGESRDRVNSWVAVISHQQLVPADVAVYWSQGRAADLSACNRLRLTDGVTVVDRQHSYSRTPRQPGPLHVRPHVEPFVTGRSLIDLLGEARDSSEARQHLMAWTQLLTTSTVDGQVPWDLIPRNVVVDESGTLTPIDQEWDEDGSTYDEVLRRGCFWSAVDLTDEPTRPGWLLGGTVGQVADFLMRLVDDETTADWLEDFVRAEAVTTSWVTPVGPHQSRTFFEQQNGRILSSISQSTPGAPSAQTDSDAVDDGRDDSLQEVVDSLLRTNEELRARIRELEFQRRHDILTQRDHSIGLTAELETMRDRVDATRAAQKLAMTKVRDLRVTVADMESSTTWKVGRALVRPFARVRGRR